MRSASHSGPLEGNGDHPPSRDPNVVTAGAGVLQGRADGRLVGRELSLRQRGRTTDRRAPTRQGALRPRRASPRETADRLRIGDLTPDMGVRSPSFGAVGTRHDRAGTSRCDRAATTCPPPAGVQRSQSDDDHIAGDPAHDRASAASPGGPARFLAQRRRRRERAGSHCDRRARPHRNAPRPKRCGGRFEILRKVETAGIEPASAVA